MIFSNQIIICYFLFFTKLIQYLLFDFFEMINYFNKLSRFVHLYDIRNINLISNMYLKKYEQLLFNQIKQI